MISLQLWNTCQKKNYIQYAPYIIRTLTNQEKLFYACEYNLFYMKANAEENNNSKNMYFLFPACS